MVKTSPNNHSHLSPSVTSPEPLEDSLFLTKEKSPFPGLSWWQKKSIRWKATILAVALGTIPTAALGLVAYWAADNSIRQQVSSVRKTLAVEVQNEVNLFMQERFKDIQIMANLDILTNPQIRDRLTPQDKAATLERIQETYKAYNSIAVFDLQGNVIAQTGQKPLDNHLNRGYIQAALKSDRAVLSQPRISTSSGIYSIYTAAPVKDRATGQTIAVIRARIPVESLKELLEGLITTEDNYYLLDKEGNIFLGSTGEYVVPVLSNNETASEAQTTNYEAVKIETIYSGIDSLLQKELPATIDTATNKQDRLQKFIAYAPPKTISELPDLNWSVLLTTDSSLVFAPQRNLGQIYILGTIGISIFAGIIAYYFTELATRPILTATKTVNDIGQGDLTARLEIAGEDEIAQLGDNINKMASQLAEFVREQHLLARQTETIKETVVAFSSVSEARELWQVAVEQAQKALNCSGVTFYDSSSQQIVAESLGKNAIAIKDKDIYEPDFLEAYQEINPQTLVLSSDKITPGLMSQSQIAKLQTNGIAQLAIAKIEQQDQIIGLLTAHSNSFEHSWRQSDLDFLIQFVNQIDSTLNRLDFQQQQQTAQIKEQQAKEQLQRRALELLMEVDSLSEGDLTIRATVTEDEIGTIADSYNATIYSLQNLVTQVKAAVGEVEQNAGSNQVVITQLATNAIEQAQSMAKTMQQIQTMTESITEVSQRASQAEEIVREADRTIVSGDLTMDRAVAQINGLRTTVDEAEQKVKLLGESSQEISQVVNSISRFAAQTHLLALKASIEAARAGEQGKGFATIADEVRSLAAQSATASTDIENLVARIQLETNEVVSAMAQGTKQVNLGAEFVSQTRQNLHQVTEASQAISQLIVDIARLAQGQSGISHQVRENINRVAISAQTNSQSATQVSLQIEELLAVATKLQTNIDRFKT